MKKYDKKRLAASFTVEAAFVMPVLILLFAVIMKLGISLYRETWETAEKYMQATDFQAAELFRKTETVIESRNEIRGERLK